MRTALDIFTDSVDIDLRLIDEAIEEVQKRNWDFLCESEHKRMEICRAWAEDNVSLDAVCEALLEDYDGEDYDEVLDKVEKAEAEALKQEEIENMQRAEDEYQRSIEEPIR